MGVLVYVCMYVCMYVRDTHLRVSRSHKYIHTYIHTYICRDKGEKVTEMAARGLYAIRNTAVALTNTIRSTRDVPTASWMGGHGRTTTVKGDDW